MAGIFFCLRFWRLEVQDQSVCMVGWYIDSYVLVTSHNRERRGEANSLVTFIRVLTPFIRLYPHDLIKF